MHHDKTDEERSGKKMSNEDSLMLAEKELARAESKLEEAIAHLSRAAGYHRNAIETNLSGKTGTSADIVFE